MKTQLTIVLFFINACSSPTNPSVHSIDSSNAKAIVRKHKNLVFIWSTWCAASREILGNTYQYLQVDTNEVSVSIICGNSDLQEIRDIYRKYHLHYDTLIISNASNYIALLDRKNIRSFIQKSFRHYELANTNGNFGLPVTLLVDESNTIINACMPQDTAAISQALLKIP